MGYAASASAVTLSTENHAQFLEVLSTTGGAATITGSTVQIDGNVYAPGVFNTATPTAPGAGSTLVYTESGAASGGDYVFVDADGLRFGSLNGYAPGEFDALASTQVGSLGNGSVMAMDHVNYGESFTFTGGTDATFNVNNSITFILGLYEGECKADANGYVKALITFVFNGVATNYSYEVAKNFNELNVIYPPYDPNNIVEPNSLSNGITDLSFDFFNTVSGLDAALTYAGFYTVDLWTTSQVSSVPEPGTFVLVGAGLFGLALWRKRRV